MFKKVYIIGFFLSLMSKLIVVGIIVLALIVGIFYFAWGRMGVEANAINSPASDSSDVTFVLTGENFKFVMNGVDNPDLVVQQGDRVKIEFASVGGFHDWVVDEFDAATGRVNDGETTSVEFIADERGTFEYYCSVGQHRTMGMKGNLIVE